MSSYLGNPRLILKDRTKEPHPVHAHEVTYKAVADELGDKHRMIETVLN